MYCDLKSQKNQFKNHLEVLINLTTFICDYIWIPSAIGNLLSFKTSIVTVDSHFRNVCLRLNL